MGRREVSRVRWGLKVGDSSVRVEDTNRFIWGRQDLHEGKTEDEETYTRRETDFRKTRRDEEQENRSSISKTVLPEFTGGGGPSEEGLRRSVRLDKQGTMCRSRTPDIHGRCAGRERWDDLTKRRFVTSEKISLGFYSKVETILHE